MPLNARKKGSDKMIKTFRGLLADGGQDRIRLQTINGKMGYRIVKFQAMATSDNVNLETVLKIHKISTTPSATINFTDSNLLAACLYNESTGSGNMPTPIIIFDQEIFNQDIFITNKGSAAGEINYYLELEVIPLTDQGAEYTTLKDIRTQS